MSIYNSSPTFLSHAPLNDFVADTSTLAMLKMDVQVKMYNNNLGVVFVSGLTSQRIAKHHIGSAHCAGNAGVLSADNTICIRTTFLRPVHIRDIVQRR